MDQETRQWPCPCRSWWHNINVQTFSSVINVFSSKKEDTNSFYSFPEVYCIAFLLNLIWLTYSCYTLERKFYLYIIIQENIFSSRSQVRLLDIVINSLSAHSPCLETSDIRSNIAAAKEDCADCRGWSKRGELFCHSLFRGLSKRG